MMACPGSPKREDVSGLDQIIKNTEYENSQQTKAIETERERIEAYQRQLEEKQREICELEESSLQLDDHANRLHKQFKLNRENYEGLKQTSSVLDEHEEALKKALEAAQRNAEQQRVQHEETLKKYEGIWASYQAKYDSFEKARELNKMQEELKLLENQNDGLQRQIEELEASVSQLQIQNGEEGTLVAWVLQIAALRVETKDTLGAVKMNQVNSVKLEGEIAELQQRVDEAQEALKQWEAKRKLGSQVETPEHGIANPAVQQHNARFTFITPHNTQTLPSTSATMTAPTVTGGRSENSPPSSHYLGRNITTSVQPQPLSSPNQVNSLQTSILGQSNRANNALILPQLSQDRSTASSIKPTAQAICAGPTTHTIATPKQSVLFSNSGPKQKSSIQVKSMSAHSKYMLEIPQLSSPRVSAPNGNLSKTNMGSQKSQPLQTARKSGNSSGAIPPSTPQPRVLLSQLQIPLLETPTRPRPSEKALQPPRRSSSQFTFPTLLTQRPKPLQSKLMLSSDASNGAVSTLDGNITATNGKKTQDEKCSTEVMDTQENAGAIILQSATNQFTASSNQDQPEERDQHNQQQSDPWLQENADQGSQLDDTYGGVYNADGSTSAEGYVYGEYEGDMVPEEFAEGQMMAGEDGYMAMQPQDSAGFFPSDQAAVNQSGMYYGGFGSGGTVPATGTDFGGGFGFSGPPASSSSSGMNFGFGFGGGATPTAPQQNNQGFTFAFGGNAASGSQSEFSFF